MKKQITYTHYQKLIKDKDKAINLFISNMLAKTQSMFRYDGLPETLPQSELERMLQTNGKTFITKVDGELYALYGSSSGEMDAYNRPTTYVVSNPALKLNKTYNIKEDGILMLNDTNGNGLLDIIGSYAVLYVDGVISLNSVSILSRIPMLISASDDRTKESADNFIEKILDGDFSIIGENAFFKGITTHSTQSNSASQITQLIELIQYYKASMYNELGLNANYNMKRERLNMGEVSMNIDILLPYVDNMLVERKKAVELINEMFDTEIEVELASSWEISHDVIEHQIEGDPNHSTEDVVESTEDVVESTEDVVESTEDIEDVETTEKIIEDEEVKENIKE